MVQIDFKLALAFRKFNFPISTILTPRHYLVNILKSWMTNYSWIPGQTFRKQRYALYNDSKINDIKLRSDILSDFLSSQVHSPKLSLAIHSQQIVSNPQKSPMGLACLVLTMLWFGEAESESRKLCFPLLVKWYLPTVSGPFEFDIILSRWSTFQDFFV